MKLKDVFEKSVQFFKDKKIDTPRLDAELLIAHALKFDRVQIYVKYEQPLSVSEVTACRELVRRRSQGEPVAYILGEKGFYGLLFNVGVGVLIPRPETEAIVEQALNFITKKKIENPRILDLGAGTGCIGFSILKNSPLAKLVSIEKSEQAFAFLESNLSKLELSDRATLIKDDVTKFEFSLLEPFDIIVSNPPYIAENDPMTEAMVKKFEPSEALFANNNGLELVMKWSVQTKELLKSPGIMLFEIGHKQGPTLKQHFEGLKVFSEVQIIKDLSGLDRIIKSVR